MFKKIAVTTIAASALLISMQASAAGYGHNNRDNGINKEQREQAVMIQQGIKTCQITPSEARTLQSAQKSIATLERKFKANGMRKWEIQTLKNKLHDARVVINKLSKNRTNCRSESRSDNRGHGAANNRGDNRSNSHSYNYNSNNSRNSFTVTRDSMGRGH